VSSLSGWCWDVQEARRRSRGQHIRQPHAGAARRPAQAPPKPGRALTAERPRSSPRRRTLACTPAAGWVPSALRLPFAARRGAGAAAKARALPGRPRTAGSWKRRAWRRCSSRPASMRRARAPCLCQRHRDSRVPWSRRAWCQLSLRGPWGCSTLGAPKRGPEAPQAVPCPHTRWAASSPAGAWRPQTTWRASGHLPPALLLTGAAPAGRQAAGGGGRAGARGGPARGGRRRARDLGGRDAAAGGPVRRLARALLPRRGHGAPARRPSSRVTCTRHPRGAGHCASGLAARCSGRLAVCTPHLRNAPNRTPQLRVPSFSLRGYPAGRPGYSTSPAVARHRRGRWCGRPLCTLRPPRTHGRAMRRAGRRQAVQHRGAGRGRVWAQGLPAVARADAHGARPGLCGGGGRAAPRAGAGRPSHEQARAARTRRES